MKKITTAATLLIALLCIQSNAFSQDTLVLKKRIALIDFTDATEGQVKTASVELRSNTLDQRQGNVQTSNYSGVIKTMLTTELVKSNTFLVVERQQLDAILKEQDFGQSGAVTPQSATKINQLLGVQLLITGSITEYGVKLQNKESSAGRAFTSNKQKSTARVSLDLRILNASTGEIIVAETASGSAAASAGGLKVFGIGSNSVVDDNSLMDSALRKAVVNCVALIKTAAKKVVWEGSIIKVTDDGTAIIKPGSDGGVRADMAFSVYRKGENIIDPETGLSLGSEIKKIGTIKVVSDIGEGKAAKAKIIDGVGIKKGDIIRLE